jgi:hypothetical protein
MKTIILSLLCIGCTFVGTAQLEVGVRAGVSSMDLADNLVITLLTEQGLVSISPTDADYGFHFGLYTRLSIAGFYIEPALLFNSSSVTYKVREVSEDGVLETLRAESYRDIDIPFVVGVKKSIFRFYGGPVASFHLDSTSDLVSIDGYRQNFDSSTFGFRVGVGLDIWRVRLDLGYEGSLSRFGDHVNIGGRDFAFDDQPGRLLGSVGVKF